ncbi:MAG: DUF4157 domain-containing protein, partial [Chitinophagaceae bacterium]|nr:DUF4157 domain-containing protein [Chitinophagaceae bacterium]
SYPKPFFPKVDTRVGIQRKSEGNTAGSHGAQAPSTVQTVLSSSGKKLDTDTKQFMSARLGRNFDNVRVHTNHIAERSAEAINARAYTVGNNIFFGTGEYQPKNAEGRKLLAHELAHTVQQEKSLDASSIIQRKEKAVIGKEKNAIPTQMPCTPTAMSRAAFLKATKTSEFGLTKIVVNQANLLSSPYIQFTNVGRKVRVEPLTLNMPVIESSYVGQGQFIEGKTKNQIDSNTCPMDFYPINWNITPTGAASIAEAEQEHCNDYNYAYRKTVYPFLVEVNKIAGKTFDSTTAVDRYLAKKLKFDPHDWFSKFSCMLGNSTVRDHSQSENTPAWHEPLPIRQLLPSARTNCAYVTMAITSSSFTDLNNAHPSNVIIPTGC